MCPRKQTSETVFDTVLSECESTRPLNLRTQTSPRGEFAPGSALALISWKDACQALCWWVWDLEWGGVPRLFWVWRLEKLQSSLLTETCSFASFLSNLHSSCFRIRGFRVRVRDYAMPSKQGGLHLNWRAYTRSYAEQPAWDSWNRLSCAQEPDIAAWSLGSPASAARL